MEGIFPSPVEAETEEEMFTMPTIDMVATGRNIMRLREAAGLNVRDLQDKLISARWSQLLGVKDEYHF